MDRTLLISVLAALAIAIAGAAYSRDQAVQDCQQRALALRGVWNKLTVDRVCLVRSRSSSWQPIDVYVRTPEFRRQLFR